MAFPTAYLVEIEFTPGVWTDVTADVDSDAAVDITRGRLREEEDPAPGSMTFTLRDIDGRYVPGNITSPHYPNVVERKRVRFTATPPTGSPSVRFLGYILSWKPSLPAGGAIQDGVCVVTAATRDALASRALFTRWVETLRANDPNGAIYPLTTSGAATEMTSIGGAATGYRLDHKGLSTEEASGSGSFGEVERLALDGAFSFQPAGTRGPMLVFPSSDTGNVTHVSFWFRTETEVPTGETRMIATNFGTSVAGRGAGFKESRSWALQLERSAADTNLVLYGYELGLSTNLGTLASRVNDGRWRHIQVSETMTVDREFTATTEGEAVSTTLQLFYPPDSLGNRLLGFGADPSKGIEEIQLDGRHKNAPTFELGPVYIGGVAPPAPATAGLPWTSPHTVTSTISDLNDFGGISGVTVGAEDHAIGHSDLAGKTLWEARGRTARTVGAVAWVNPGGDAELRLPDAVRTTTPVLTAELGTDDSGTLEVSREVDSLPTRATITHTGGTTLVVGTETDGLSQEVSVDADSRDSDQAALLGQFLISEGEGLRINKLSLALHATPSNLYAQAWALYPGARVRITNLIAQWFGATEAAVTCQGWTESYGRGGVYFDLDCTPADQPRAFFFEASGGDRVAATSTTLTSALTDSATSLSLTVGGGEVWSVDAGDYPLKIRIDAEVISVPSAPASGSAPSWTGVTRAVDGSLPRAHSAGASVDVAYPVTLAL